MAHDDPMTRVRPLLTPLALSAMQSLCADERVGADDLLNFVCILSGFQLPMRAVNPLISAGLITPEGAIARGVVAPGVRVPRAPKAR